MNLFWLVSIFSFCVGTAVQGALKPEVLNVGAIFSLGTINGQVSRIAMKAAQDDINSDPRVLGGRKLSITIHDTKFSGFLSIMGGTVFLLLVICQPIYLALFVSCTFLLSFAWLRYHTQNFLHWAQHCSSWRLIL